MTIGLLYAISALASALTAGLAWLAKLKWSKEFADAKEATIKAKDAQIETLKSHNEAVVKAKDVQIEALQSQLDNLRELSPMKIQEYFKSTKEQLEAYIDSLKGQLKEANASIESMGMRIKTLQGTGETQLAEIERLKTEKTKLERTTATLESQVTEFERGTRQFDPALIDRIASSSNALARLVPDSSPELDLENAMVLQHPIQLLKPIRLIRKPRNVEPDGL